MKTTLKSVLAILAVVFMMAVLFVPSFAANEEAQASTEPVTQTQETEEAGADGLLKTKAIAAAAIISIVAGTGAVIMGIVIKGANDNIARQPEASGNIRSTFMLGLVFIETAIIYALIVAILIIFVL